MPKKYRILVIDDEDAIRESLRAFLEDYDYEVSAAGSAEEAMRLLKTQVFDLAVVDMRLPGESGETFIVKVSESGNAMRFVIHTGSVEFQLTDVLKHHGVKSEHVYLKPLHDLAILADGIGALLHNE
ncbi:response regulator [Sedimenticola selenatireducens]|jgi:DNA-binding NtrC family response regulator|uniref:Response regulator n=1 Tax=Sedimenticola selenatireducens TaxID=191960 RepID=A0A558DPA7_9GAMM|nr:response regulator [Sedimenticola selenatireducens]TVO78324.1 response regulator [Sedimenticola selenatireducens]TVT62818.1 MAG: response regulator [Sedimenticola selenatireducens]